VESPLPLREIRCFVTVAEELGFSRAGRRLGMSQPAVSQAVARLERALGVRLFDRTSRDVRLTDTGAALLPLAESLLAEAARFAEEAARRASATSRPIRLGYCPLVGTLAARVARQVRARSPRLDVELRPAGWAAATDDLSRGAVTAALMSAPFPAGHAVSARFHVPISHLAVPRGDPLAAGARLRLDHPVRLRVVMPRLRPPGSGWAQLAARLPADPRPAPTGPDSDDLLAWLDLVAAGECALPVPRLLVDTVRRDDVAFVPIEAPTVRMTYGLVWSTGGTTAAEMTLVDVVQQIIRTGGR